MSDAPFIKVAEIYPQGSNRLVSSFPSAQQQEFRSKSVEIELTWEQVLLNPGDPIEFCYFPTKGIISLVALMSSGAGAEVGLAGTEGFVGVGAILGASRIAYQALVQGPGKAHRIATRDLLSLKDSSPEVAAILLAYGNSFMTFVAQGAACNALHKAEARLARWILLVEDRMQEEALPITHEFIANMLGTRRATVTVIANTLENEGLIALGRREIKILNREGLRKASCECYFLMTDAIGRAVSQRD